MPELRSPQLWANVEAAVREWCRNGEVHLTVQVQDGVAVHAWVERARASIKGEGPTARKELL